MCTRSRCYWHEVLIGPDDAGLFGAFELGMFRLDEQRWTRRGTGPPPSNDVKFGMGFGIGVPARSLERAPQHAHPGRRELGNALMSRAASGTSFAGSSRGAEGCLATKLEREPCQPGLRVPDASAVRDAHPPGQRGAGAAFWRIMNGWTTPMVRAFPPTRHSASRPCAAPTTPSAREGSRSVGVYWRPVYTYLRLRWHKPPRRGRGSRPGVLRQVVEKDLLRGSIPRGHDAHVLAHVHRTGW